MDGKEMPKQFILVIVCLSLFPFISVAQDTPCKMVPVASLGVTDEQHTLTCFAKPGCMILSWKQGLGITVTNLTGRAVDSLPAYAFNLSTLGVETTGESAPLTQPGYLTTFESLRKSTMTFNPVKKEHAGAFHCFVFDHVAKSTASCKSDLTVVVGQPQLASSGIDLATGLITNISCSINFEGPANVNIKIIGRNNVVCSQDNHNFPEWISHSARITCTQTAIILQETYRNRSYHRVFSDHGLTSNFSCNISSNDRDFRRTIQAEFDAPVSYVKIVPHNVSRCSQRTCYMHERLICTTDGYPKPTAYDWLLSVNYENFKVMRGQMSEQLTLDGGRNTYECRVYNTVKDYDFTAAGRFTSHVQAFEWVLDDYASFISKGRSIHKAWSLMTIVAPLTAIIWVLLTWHKCFCCRFQ